MFKNLAEVRRANSAIGHHWFEPSEMDFFGTRIETGLIGRFFITSDAIDSSEPRRFTIREVHDDGSVNTWGMFQAYDTLQEARSALSKI